MDNENNKSQNPDENKGGLKDIITGLFWLVVPLIIIYFLFFV
jgi:hypothetical protein